MFRLTALSIGSLSTAILIGVLTAYLIAIPNKPRALLHLIGYFASIALLAATYFVRYSFLTPVVVPISYLSDLVVIGIANLVWFAFHFPSNDFPRAARIAGRSFSVLAVFAYFARFIEPNTLGYRFDSHYLAIRASSMVGIVVVAGYAMTGVVLLIKARRYARSADAKTQHEDKLSSVEGASATRSFAVQAFMSMAVALTFLLLALDLINRSEYQTIFNFGSMIITMAIFISYINYSPVPVSLREKLSGITLAVVLIVAGFAGTLSLLLADEIYHRDNQLAASQSVQLDPPSSNSTPYVARVSGQRSNGTASYDVLDPGVHAIDARTLRASDEAMEAMAREAFNYSLPDPVEDSFDHRLVALDDFQTYFTIYRVRDGADLYEVGYPYAEYRDYAHQFGLVFWWLLIAATVLVLVSIPLFFRNSVLEPLRGLLGGVEQMDQGRLDVTVPVHGRDELGRLSDSFNQMVASVRTSTNEREQLNVAYKRFVPTDLLTLLGKQSILEVRLGDQIMRTMSVMFTDIRSFTTLSEQMSPDDNFRFLNRYLGHVAPVINRHSGYIDKYLGDGILSVFPESAMSAVQAAIALQDAVGEFNVEQENSGQPPIAVGCGIHSGSVMLGTIGAAERMDGTVIADSVNLASRVEGLNKTLGTSILATEVVANQLTGVPVRRLGPVQVVGKSNAVVLFEVLHGATAFTRGASTQEFEHALAAFAQGDIRLAQERFEAIATADKTDTPAAYYAAYCAHLLESEVGGPHEAFLKIREK